MLKTSRVNPYYFLLQFCFEVFLSVSVSIVSRDSTK